MPRLTLNLGIRFDGLPHAFERYNQFANFVAGRLYHALGYPLDRRRNYQPAFLTSSNGGLFYLNGVQLAGSMAFRAGLSRIITIPAAQSRLCL